MDVEHRQVTDPAAGRAFVSDALAGQCPEAIDTARLLVSELVTNALLHARATRAEVTIRITDGHAHVAVSDDSPDLPEVPVIDLDTVGGFGLHIVEQLSHRWGVTPNDDGKTVWVELGCEHSAQE